MEKKNLNPYSYEKKPLAIKGREIMTLGQMIVAKMSKNFKYQIGQGLLNLTAEIAYSIYDALDFMGFNETKKNKVEKILSYIRKTVITTRVAKDLNLLTVEHFEKLINDLVSLKVQTQNWVHFIDEKMKEEKEKVLKNGQ